MLGTALNVCRPDAPVPPKGEAMPAVLICAVVLPLLIAQLMLSRDFAPWDVAQAYVGALLGLLAVGLYLRSTIRGWCTRPGQPILPALPLACAVGYLWYFIIGPIPSIQDPSFLRYTGGSRFYGPAYLYAGLCLAAYIVGAVLFRSRRRVPALKQANPGFLVDLQLVLLLVTLFVWAMRIVLGAHGRFGGHGSWKQQLSGAPMYLAYAHNTLRFVIIPLAEYLRTRRTGRARAVLGALSWLELGTYLVSGHRTELLGVAIQFGLARTLFNGWSYFLIRRRVVLGLALFFLVLNPLVVATRLITEGGGSGGGANQILENLAGMGQAMETADSSTADITHTYERDFKYRINSLYYVSAMMETVSTGRAEPGMGRFTLRNAASVVPGFLWPGKYQFAVSHLKAEVARELRMPVVDYIQMLPAHWFSDFGWAGVLLMFATGALDALVWGLFRRRMNRISVRLFYLTIFLSFLFPIEDFVGHFLMKWRETLPLFMALYMMELRSLRVRVTSGPPRGPRRRLIWIPPLA